MTDQVSTDITGPVARITLKRPDARNGLTDEMLDEIEAGVITSDETEDVRCVVVDAEGPAFCVGADISVVETYDNDELRSFLRHATDVFRAIERAQIPFISAVNGHALGGGMELMMATDLTVAHEESTFGVPEAKIGLLPAAGGTQRLPRIVGKKVASELLFTGESIDANRAYSLGLVNEVTTEAPVDRAIQLAESIAKSAPLSVAACKQLVTEGIEQPIDDALDLEQELAYDLIDSEDSSEGVSAFLEKRESEFKNR